MSAFGEGLVLDTAGLVIFCVYETVVLDSSEYTMVWLASSLECMASWRVLLAKSSRQDGICVLVNRGPKRSAFVRLVLNEPLRLSFLGGGKGVWIGKSNQRKKSHRKGNRESQH